MIAAALAVAVPRVRPRPPFGRPRPTRERRPYIPRTVRRAVPLRRQAVRRAAMPLRRPVVAPAPVLRGSVSGLARRRGRAPAPPIRVRVHAYTRVVPTLLHLC